MKTVVGPDDTEFEFPDDMTDEDISSVLRKHYGIKLPGEMEVPKGAIPTPLESQQAIQKATEGPGLGEKILEGATSPEAMKMAMEAGGGMLGAAAALPTGPGAPAVAPATAALGTLAGGALGAMAGRALFGAVTGEDVESQVKGMLKEGELDLLYSAGFMSAGRALNVLGPYVGKSIFGITDEAADIAESARTMRIPKTGEAKKESLDIPLGILNVSEGKLAKSYAKVVGVFPFAGSPHRKAGQRAEKALLQRKEDFLDAVAPTVTLHDAGVDIYKAAENTHQGFRRTASNLYESFFNYSNSIGSPKAVPTTPIKQSVGDLYKNEMRPTMQTGEVLPTPKSDELDDYLKNLLSLEDFISPEEWRVIQEDLNFFYNKAAIKGHDVAKIAQTKEALSISMSALDPQLAGDNGPMLKKLIDTANSFYSTGMAHYETATAKKIGRVDKNIFGTKAFKAGTVTADKIADAIIATRSPQAIRELRQITDDDVIHKTARSFLEDKARAATVHVPDKGDVFSFSRWEKAIGMDSKEGKAFIDESLKGSGVNAKTLEKLIKVGKAHDEIRVGDPSVFLSRRIVLEGARRGATGLLGIGATAANPASLLVSLPTLFLVRQGSKAISSPKILNWMTIVLDETKPQLLRNAIAGKLAKELTTE